MDVLDIPTLETERLRLRPFRESDFEDYAELCGDPRCRAFSACGSTASRPGDTWRS
jgi:RimJ/RimL family protein N-acetyltransferase